MRTLALIFATSAVLLGQPNANEIVRRSLAAADRGWKARDTYKYVECDDERRLDSSGGTKSESVDISRVIFVNGNPFDETIGHNGGAPTPSEKRKDQEAIRKLKSETPAERQARLEKERENRDFIHEVPKAFNFRLIGRQQVNGRTAYVLFATPIPGYHAHSKYGKIFPKVNGKLWVDAQDYGWVRVEANVMEPFSMGFVARIQRGSHIVFEQERVADGIWLPKRIEVRAAARVFFFMNYATDETITYSGYHPAQPSELALAGPRKQ